MKNKQGINLWASEKFIGDLPVNSVEEQRTPKHNERRASMAPKIVVCPPIEEMTEPINPPRGGRLLKALKSRLSRRNNDSDSVGSSSSSDSGENGRAEDRSSCSISESGSDGSDRQHRHHSTVSLRRVFQSLNLIPRSQSSSPVPRQPKKQSQPKRILRPPVTYTYVRGLSGLPTQRVPRKACCTSSGLNR